MSKLDNNYIGKLVEFALNDDSNAMAELYVATCQKQFALSYLFFNDMKLAEDAMKQTYVNAFSSLRSLVDPKLFVIWLNQLNFRTCYDILFSQSVVNTAPSEEKKDSDILILRRAIKVGNTKYHMSHILALPFSESQAVFLYFFRKMSVRDIAEVLETEPASVRQHISEGRKRLKEMMADKGGVK